MKAEDAAGFAFGALRGYRARSLLMILAMAIGVAAVVVLTALGDGARRYVTGQFASLGTNLVIVLPGRSETTGGGMPMGMAATPRDLTLDDALALTRSHRVRRVAPIVIGSAAVSWGGLERDVPVMGSTAQLREVRHLELAQGRFLPAGDPQRGSPVVVMGAKVRDELFGAHRALGEWVRIGDRRFRVIGILRSEGRSLGVDIQELVIIPVASAQRLFNAPSLFRILVQARSREAVPGVKRFVVNTLRDRHQGEEDVTVVTQDAVLATFDKIFRALTLTVAGIGGISLAVAGILVMNVMLVAVSQRTGEIGLLKALGAPSRQILVLFLAEAAMLSLLGALAGLAAGGAGTWLLAYLYPVLPARPPLWAVGAAVGVALGTGLVFGTLPARRAARLDPVQALARH